MNAEKEDTGRVLVSLLRRGNRSFGRFGDSYVLIRVDPKVPDRHSSGPTSWGIAARISKIHENTPSLDAFATNRCGKGLGLLLSRLRDSVRRPSSGQSGKVLTVFLVTVVLGKGQTDKHTHTLARARTEARR